jgi:hypothetical protein
MASRPRAASSRSSEVALAWASSSASRIVAGNVHSFGVGLRPGTGRAAHLTSRRTLLPETTGQVKIAAPRELGQLRARDRPL